MYSFLRISCLLVLFTCVNRGQLCAQKVAFPDGKTIHTDIPGDYADVTILYRNNTSAPMDINWARVSVTMQAGWETGMCNNGTCLPAVMNSGSIQQLPANTEAFLRLHVSTYHIQGNSRYVFVLYPANDSSQPDTLVYDVTCTSTTGIAAAGSSGSIQLEQAGNRLTFVHNKNLELAVQLYTTAGVLMEDKTIRSGNGLDLDGMATGVYLVQVSDQEGNRLFRRVVRY